MKNTLKRILALLLCLLLLCPAALAQDGYKMGQPSNQMVIDAFMSGKLLKAAINMDMELDAAALGMSEEEAAMVPMVLGLLRQATITGGVARLDDGLRIELAGELANEAGTESVAVTAAANVTIDGLSLESNLLTGRRVTMKWETLLALAGLGEAEIAEFTAIKEELLAMDPDEMTAMLEEAVVELAEQVGPAVESAALTVEPYLTLFTDWLFALPMEVSENLTEEGYPPTATEIAITMTVKDLGDLLTKLCNQLDQDAEMQSYIEMILAQSGESISAADLIAELRASAAQMTDTSMPMTFFLGMNEEGIPMYLELIVANEEIGETLYTGLFCYEDVEEGLVLSLTLGLYDAEGNALTGIYAGGSYLGDAADENIHDFMAYLRAEDGGSVVSMFYDYAVARAADSELPAYDVAAQFGIALDEEELIATSEGRMGLTEAGGEFVNDTSVLESNLEGQQMSINATVESLLEPTEDGGFTGYYLVSESMPFAGIDAVGVIANVSTETYDAAATAALNVVELETLSNDEMDALINEISEVLMNEKVNELVSVLPQDVLDLLMAE